MQFSTIQDTQYTLMKHETLLEQQNALSHISIPNTLANIAYNNNHSSGNHSSSSNKGNFRKRGGKGRGRRNTQLYYQLCKKHGHDALKYHKHFNIY